MESNRSYDEQGYSPSFFSKKDTGFYESKVKKIKFSHLSTRTKNSVIRFLAAKKIDFSQLKETKSTTVKFTTDNHKTIMVVIQGNEVQQFALKSPLPSKYHLGCHHGDELYRLKNEELWDGSP